MVDHKFQERPEREIQHAWFDFPVTAIGPVVCTECGVSQQAAEYFGWDCEPRHADRIAALEAENERPRGAGRRVVTEAVVEEGKMYSGHEHCWHDTGRMLTSSPPQAVEWCCWCGETRIV